MKQCPKCGARFEAGTYCDEDGTYLVEAQPSRRPARRARWLLLAVAVLIAAFVVVGIAERYVRWNADVVLDDVLLPGGRSLFEPAKGSGSLSSLVESVFDVVRVATDQGDLTLRLRVENGSSMSGTLVAAQYSITLGQSEIGSGKWQAAEPVSIPAGKEVALDLPLRPHSSEILEVALNAAAGSETAVRVEGRITLKIRFLGEVEMPFNVRRVSLRI